MTVHNPSPTMLVVEEVGGFRFEATVPPNTDPQVLVKFENLCKLLLKDCEKSKAKKVR